MQGDIRAVIGTWQAGDQSDCSAHDCWRVAPGGYCVAPRCYCGGCPWYVPIELQATHTPDGYTAVDRKAILSSTGRRTNLAEYREAQRR